MDRLIMVFGVLFVGAIAALKGASHEDSPTTIPVTSPPKMVEVKRVDDLTALYDHHGFDVETIRQSDAPVPQIHLASLPVDIKATKQGSKKHTFIQVMLPLILKANEVVLSERKRLTELKHRLDRGGMLRAYESEWVTYLAEKYRVKSESIDELLIKVDVIPPSLALAQASLESGWLMSPAARLKNSTFGHMATKKDVEGFKSLYANVEAYVLNLNRHHAYRDLRKRRAEMRKRGEDVCSISLAKGLKSYSERGMAYIRDIEKMILQNDFQAFDESALDT